MFKNQAKIGMLNLQVVSWKCPQQNWHKSINPTTAFLKKMQRGEKEWKGLKPDNGVDRTSLRQTSQNLIWQQPQIN